MTFTGIFASDQTAYQMSPNLEYFHGSPNIPRSKRSSKDRQKYGLQSSKSQKMY